MFEPILRINYSALLVLPCPSRLKNVRQRFRCWLDDGTLVGPETGLRSPALDGARWLVGQGVSPDRLMTTRAAPPMGVHFGTVISPSRRRVRAQRVCWGWMVI